MLCFMRHYIRKQRALHSRCCGNLRTCICIQMLKLICEPEISQKRQVLYDSIKITSHNIVQDSTQLLLFTQMF
jgi:hypothetical protein